MMSEKQGLFVKIARIMGNIERLPQSGLNKHFSYKYATAEDVSDVVRGELSRENIAFFASMTNLEQNGKHTVVTFEYTFVCADTGETHTSTWFGEADDSQDKGISKAATLAEKSFFLKTFVLSSGDPSDDPDSQAPVEDTSATKDRQTRQKARSASKPAASSSSKPSASNGAQNGKPPDDPVYILAAETFPFDIAWKDKTWEALMKAKPNWNTTFWTAVKELNVTNEELHKAVNVNTINDYKGTPKQLWLEVCKLAKAS